MKHVQEEKAPLLAQIEHLKGEVNTMKLNIIASGQIVAGFTTEQGMALTGDVAKLSEKLEGLMKEQDKLVDQAKEEASTNVEQVMILINLSGL